MPQTRENLFYDETKTSGLDSFYAFGCHAVMTPSTMNGFAHTNSQATLPATVTSYQDTFIQEGKDDFELMLLHVDFPKLVELTARVKKARKVLVDTPASAADVRSAPKASDVQKAVDRMQAQLLRDPHLPRRTIPRGQRPVIDGTIDDSVRTLQKEWDYLVNWIERRPVSPVKPKMKDKQKRGRAKKEAIAIKYSKWQTDILMAWMIDHKNQPFPDQEAINDLMRRTGLNQSQVVNWTTNVRKRNRKATCEGGKKPHHFIDFLFLVQGRDTPAIERSATFPLSKSETKLAKRTETNRLKRKNRSSTHALDASQVSPTTCTSTYSGRSQDVFRRRSAANSVRSATRPRQQESHTVPSALAKLGSSCDEDDMDEGDDDSAAEIYHPLPYRETSVDFGILKEFAEIWETECILPTVTNDSLDEHEARDLDSICFSVGDNVFEWVADMGLPFHIHPSDLVTSESAEV